MEIVDLQLNIGGLKLKDGERVEDVIEKIAEIVDSNYDVCYQVLYRESVK